MPVLIRPMQPEDIPVLVSLEQSAFSDPWSEKAFCRRAEQSLRYYTGGGAGQGCRVFECASCAGKRTYQHFLRRTSAAQAGKWSCPFAVAYRLCRGHGRAGNYAGGAAGQRSGCIPLPQMRVCAGWPAEALLPESGGGRFDTEKELSGL